MKLWRFYLKPQDRDNPNDKYSLYAFTTNKENAKLFMKYRDMDKFILRRSKIDKEDMNKFATDNRGAYLSWHTVLTKTIDDEGKFDTREVDILMTDYEQQAIDSDNGLTLDIHQESFWYSVPSYIIYTKDLQNALGALDYQNTYKIFNNDPIIDSIYDDYNVPNIYIDELNIFIQCFGQTLAKK